MDGIYHFVEGGYGQPYNPIPRKGKLETHITNPLLMEKKGIISLKTPELVDLQKSKGITVNPTVPVSWLRKSMDPKMTALK